jgi:methyl-accepting chemotaxis protein
MAFFEPDIIHNKFSAVDHKISILTGTTEKEFLQIGSKLQSFLSDSRTITDIASRTANSMSEDILNNGINELNILLKEFSDYLSKSAITIKSDEVELLKILESIHSVSDELSGFKRIVKHLRMLGISTKIESARLGNDDMGFNALADTVDRLSIMISEKAAIITNKAESLTKVISKTASDLNKLEKTQLTQSNLILKNTTTTLDAFNSKYNECSGKVSDVMNSFSKITKNISEIVTSIQFHDITRQQMEHVSEAVLELMERCKTCNELESDESKAELGFIYDVCELQVAQVSNSNNEFNKAVADIINNLGNVEDHVGDVLNKTSGLILTDKNNDTTPLNAIENELNIILSGLAKNEEITDELTASIKSVINIVDDLTKYIQQIEDIGTEIEIIALNARVKAAHTGLNGSALGVLSEAIQKLSIEAKIQTATTSEILIEIGHVSENLKKSEEQVIENNKKHNLSITQQKIGGLLSAISSMENNAASLLESLKNKVDKLNREINSSLSEITVHKTVQVSSDDILKIFEQILNNIKLVPDISNNKYHNTKDLLKRYTMQSERNVHINYSDEFESFGYQEPSKNEESGDNEFGDNVELF